MTDHEERTWPAVEKGKVASWAAVSVARIGRSLGTSPLGFAVRHSRRRAYLVTSLVVSTESSRGTDT